MNSLLGFIERMKKRWVLYRSPAEYACFIGVQIGDDCRLIGLTLSTFGSEPYLVSLGNHVTVTSGVGFLTHDGGVWVFRKEHPDIDIVAPITVGNNVFIGINTIILPGVAIGNDCIIGAGSVVTRDISSCTVAAGVPAKQICSINDYWNKVEGKAIYSRSWDAKRKKEYFQQYASTYKDSKERKNEH